VHALSGIPAPGLEKLATAKKSTLLRYDAAEIQKILAAEPQYFATVIPKGSYPGQDEDIPSFGVKCLLCVRADMDEALVYQLTEQLYAALPDLSKKRPGFANVTDKDFYLGELPLPLHDGALRYYRDQGLTEEK
jgi:TRAP transporter solute receptor, TAXI family